MPDTPAGNHQELRVIAARAGFTLTDEEFDAVAGAVDAGRARLAKLRAALAEQEEPASIFRDPSGKARS